MNERMFQELFGGQSPLKVFRSEKVIIDLVHLTGTRGTGGAGNGINDAGELGGGPMTQRRFAGTGRPGNDAKDT